MKIVFDSCPGSWKRRAGWRALAAVAVLAGVSVLPGVFAASGRVSDPEGNPVASGRVCLMVAGHEGICSDLDAQGRYILPESKVPAVRIVAKGFLPKVVAAVDQEGVIVLDRAAALRVKLVDAATNEPLAKGEVLLSSPSGHRAGPFPTNAAGLRLPTLPPGLILATGRSAGYRDVSAPAVELEAGKEAEIVLRLEPAPAESP